MRLPLFPSVIDADAIEISTPDELGLSSFLIVPVPML